MAPTRKKTRRTVAEAAGSTDVTLRTAPETATRTAKGTARKAKAAGDTVVKEVRDEVLAGARKAARAVSDVARPNPRTSSWAAAATETAGRARAALPDAQAVRETVERATGKMSDMLDRSRQLVTGSTAEDARAVVRRHPLTVGFVAVAAGFVLAHAVRLVAARGADTAQTTRPKRRGRQ